MQEETNYDIYYEHETVAEKQKEINYAKGLYDF